MDFDLILEEIGEFGKFQLTNYLLICLPVLYGAANSLSYVFTARAPNYRCFVPSCDSVENPQFREDWVKDVLPGDVSQSSGLFVAENCYKYPLKDDWMGSNNETCSADWFVIDSNNREKCDLWVFNEDERTIVNDWKLTCLENEWKLALVGTMHFAGIMAGSGIFGFLADRYGRKNLFIIAILFMSLTGVGQAVSTGYVMFLIFAFLNAVGTSGVYPLAFVIGVEMVGRRKREMSGVVLNYFYSVGEALIGVIAWLDGDWVNLQYWVSAPPILFVAYYWIIPESIRWLLAKKRNRKAFKIITKAAKNNGVKLSEGILSKFNQELDEDDEHNEMKSVSSGMSDRHNKKVTYKDLLKSKILLIRSLILLFIWGTNAFVFYGLSLNSVNLSGNIYLNFILGCLIEIPGNTVAWIIMNKLGRQISMSSMLLLCGITCIAGAFVPERIFWIQIILFLVGKLAITASFSICYVYSAEMLPTLIRSGGVGVFSTFSRFGALLAPFVPLLENIFSFLPLLLFGLVGFVAGILSLTLPETLGITLPDTIEEAESIGRKPTNNNDDDN